ncbi:MAG: hypothetical protein CL459_04735 [Acidimicrobiaceae bacterium]|nr:hypothetical protein [Acidimicrobiaceae bacterium]
MRRPARRRWRPTSGAAASPLRWVLLAFLGLLLATGCRADATVDIVVAEDGSGTVTVGLILDDEAVEVVGGIEEQLRLDDLVDAEWTVDGPRRLSTGDTTVTASKAFDAATRLPDVLDEIAGPDVFEDVALTRHRSFARTEWRLAGRVDLGGGLELFSDADLTETLSGLPLGRTDAELAELVGCLPGACDLEESFELTLSAALPGGPAADAEGARWTIGLGDLASTRFGVEGVLTDRVPRMWRNGAIVAAVLAVLATVFLVVRGFLAGRSDGPPRAVRPARTSRRADEIVEESSGAEEDRGERRLELLVLGGVGVIWDSGGDPEGLLVRFVRERGGIADPREVADRYRSASLGHVSTAEFWSSIGVRGEAEPLDREYLERVQLRRDVLPFLDRMKERGLPVACLTNAVLPWTEVLRERLGLDELMAHWVVSGEVGARKPSQAMFEALRRMSGVPFRNMLLIDSEPPTLEAARSMGMSTVLMRGSALIPEGFPHPVIGGFAELFRPSGTSATSSEGGAGESEGGGGGT